MPAIGVRLAHALHDINRRLGEAPIRWATFLRVVPDDGIALADLPAAARISKRAAKSWTTGGRGLCEVAGKTLVLTDAGRSARDDWAARVATVDDPILRAALVDLVGRFDLEFPWYPMTYGTADPSVLGGRSVAAKPGPPHIPPHGADWVPVVRTDQSSVAALPLVALVSQALVAYSADYEETLGFPMRWAAVMSRAWAGGPVNLAETPRILEITGTGKSTLERHGIVAVRAGVATLTTVGQRICDSHQRAVAFVDDQWKARYGAAVMRALLSALKSVPNKRVSDEVHVGFKVGHGFVDLS